MKDAYESMFGTEATTEADNFMPNILPLTLNKPLIKEVMEQAKKDRKWVLTFVIGTKPCFYKFHDMSIFWPNRCIEKVFSFL